MAPAMIQEIDQFETEIELKKQGKMEDRIFAETRLRRGAYGQRYDNGQRHDGTQSQKLEFPCGELTKGPHTVWDAPGMLRIKIPFGGMNAKQLEVMGDLAEEYSDGIAHITTRQDFQLHFIHIEDAPTIMRRLAAVGITTREACGNSVRNVTGCPFAGVCKDQAFDISSYADALTWFLLGHPDAQDFGRKMKIAFSGCHENACGLVNIHDMGYIATTRVENGVEKRGFKFYVGGGLGSVPQNAKLFDEFLPEEEMLPMAQAVCRIFGRYGEKKDRGRARIKFLVKDWGIDKFREEVLKERKILKEDSRWTAFLPKTQQEFEKPLKAPSTLNLSAQSDDFKKWYRTNVYHQKQEGYKTVLLALPLGDITGPQLRNLADIIRKYTHETIRTTVEQNFVIRWVSENDLPAIYHDLKAAELAQGTADTIFDIVSCPGTDTCKLGISSSRGLAGELRNRLAEQSHLLDEAVQGLHIKVSGCFNSCGQHHISDLGFYGVSRKIGGYAVPHFQVVLGGQWENNGGSYGLPVGAIPSKRIPDVVTRLTGRYVSDRQKGESFKDFVQRVGKVEIKKTLEDLTQVPSHDQDPSFYSDWGDPREYTIGDIGVGECAGEVVSSVEFDLTAAEREVFEAQVLLEKGEVQKAGEMAYQSMLRAARGLVRHTFFDVSEDSNTIVNEFKTRYFDTQIFYDPFAGGKFAQYFFSAHQNAQKPHTEESAHHLI
ncbi:MAG: nitrite/sulfite reductase, partial [Deltaproteobacteria bacterium]|nr:nitrite/sulfite reductase [Deltaproteobacteria bacterium]